MSAFAGYDDCYDEAFWVEAARRREAARQRAAAAGVDRSLERWERVVPDGYRTATWDAVLTADPPHPGKVLDPINEWLTHPIGDLVLCGQPGTGKTYLAIAAAHRMVLTHGSWPGFLAVPMLWHALKSQGGREALQQAIQAGVLILDDLGAAQGALTDWQFGELQALLPTRNANQRPTIITSNLAPADLADYLGERLRSRLTVATIVEVTGANRRRLSGGGPA